MVPENGEPYYETFDHTADLGIRVFGKDAVDLFAKSGTALFELITETGSTAAEAQVTLTVSGVDWPDVMVNWLRELLYLWTGRELLVVTIEIQSLEEFRIVADVGLVPFRPEVHPILQEVKAVTYHGLDVQQKNGGWEATIIFDI